MKLEAISQITFSEMLTVPGTQTADRVFAALPFGMRCAPRMASVWCTAFLTAHLESLCIGELHPYLTEDEDLVVGAALRLRHCSPAGTGDRVELRGMVVGIGDHEASFSVEARVGLRVVAEGEIRFVTVSRADFMSRLAIAGPTGPEKRSGAQTPSCNVDDQQYRALPSLAGSNH